MSNNNQCYKLFLVVLGGRAEKCHIELHDVRWVVSKSIEDAFPLLRNQWFGRKQGLHIDSYMEIKFIDGYKVSLVRKEVLMNSPKNKSLSEKYLWFVNYGGYDPNSLYEMHAFDVIVANSSVEANAIARDRLLCGAFNKHKDDLISISSNILLDDCYSIAESNGWKIKLIKDARSRSQKIIPDWYGFLRIDKINN